MTAMIALARRWSWAVPVVWLMNAWGLLDLLFAGYRGGVLRLDPQLLGAAFFIPTALVPILLTAHALSFRLLWAGAVQRRRTSRAKAASPAL